jgi:hypothetical protein
MSASQELTQRKIFSFWSPLAATWLMMATEGPFLAAVLARLPAPEYNLAAYGIAFAIAMIVEAPIIMIMSATIALLKGSDSFFKLRNFTYALNGAITLLMLIMLLPPVFDTLTMGLMALPADVAHLTHVGTALLLPWPAAIGFRRLYQGVLIRNNLTRRVAYGTVVRLLSMAAVAGILAVFTSVDGIIVGAAGLSAGVVGEAIASRFMAHRSILVYRQRKGTTEEEQPLTYRAIINFYYPLALTSIIGLAVNPMTTFFVGQGRFPIESLAVLPVVNSLVFIFRSFGFAFQEVGIALLGEHFENYAALKRFAITLGICTVSGLAIIAFTPAYSLWFHDVSGLSPTLSAFALTPVRIMVLLPGLSVLLSWQRSLLVTGRNNTPITISTAIEVTLIITVLYTLIFGWNAVGAVAAAVGLMTGRIFANIYQGIACRKVLQRLKPQPEVVG